MKITQMIETILSSLYMLPFMVLHPDIMSRIMKRLQNNEYKDRRQVVDDLTALITNDGQDIHVTVEISLGKESEKRRISCKREDIDRCCIDKWTNDTRPLLISHCLVQTEKCCMDRC